jgi:hypothetical protein
MIKWLSTLETGEYVYDYRKLSEQVDGTIKKYKKWFLPNQVNDDDIYVTTILTVCRLAYHFINNILTSKVILKTNMEMNSIFYLKHILSMDR